MPRTNNFVLPDADELMQLMRDESPRLAVRHDYFDNKPEIFVAYRKLMKLAGADAAYIDNWQKYSLKKLLKGLTHAARFADDYIKTHLVDANLYNELYDALSPQDELYNADAIYVFGSPFDVRIEKAIALYKDGYAPKIVISGKGPNWGTNHVTEADRMADVARNAGVPDSALLLESDSLTIVDNVKRALDVFDQVGYNPKSIIIITAPYVMRRADSSWYRFPVTPINIIRIAAESPSYQYTKSGWFKFENNRALVLNEYAKLFVEQKIDQLQQIRGLDITF